MTEHHRRFQLVGQSPSRLVLEAVGLIVALWLVLPTLAVVPISFTGRRSLQWPVSWSLQWYYQLFTDSSWLGALNTSLYFASLVTVLALLLGIPAAIVLVRVRIVGKSIARALLLAPLFSPVVVLAIGIYLIALGWGTVGTTQGFVFAYTGLAVPYVIITVAASLQNFDEDLERASASLGASPITTFLYITLPLIRPGVLAGGVFAFVTSFDELVIALFLSTPHLRTLPVLMYGSAIDNVDPTVAAASCVVVGATAAIIVGIILFGPHLKSLR